MMARLALLLAAALSIPILAAGCSITPEQGPPAEVYDLGKPAEPRASAPSLAVVVDAPRWRQGTGLYYRLGYAEPRQLRQYSQHRWAAPPSELLAQRLRERIGAAGPERARFRLAVTLHAFEQIFTGPETADVLVQGRARLTAADSGRIVAARSFRLRETAPEPNAPGAVRGLADLGEALTGELLDWAAARTEGPQ